MSKERLISHIVEKARISTQRAELAYDAFWESIISELKTGGFSLPYGAGVIHLKEKPGSALKEFAKASGIKFSAPEKEVSKTASAKKESAKKGPDKKAPAKAKEKVSKNKGKSAPVKKSAKPAKKAPVKKAPAKKAAKGKKK